MNAVVAQPAAVPRQFAARSALRRNAGKAASAAPARARRSVAVRAAGNSEVRERYTRLIRIERAGRDVEPRARAPFRRWLDGRRTRTTWHISSFSCAPRSGVIHAPRPTRRRPD